MPTINISVDHDTGCDQAEAITILKEYGDSLLADSPNADVSVSWNGGTCEMAGKVLGFSVTGEMNVGNSSTEVTVTLPIVAWPFVRNIRKEVRKRLESLL